MKRIYTTLLVISLGFSLVSCAYFDTQDDDNIVVSTKDADMIDVMEPAPVFDSEAYAQNVARRTNGSVQVFSLDRPGEAIEAYAGRSVGQNIQVYSGQVQPPRLNAPVFNAPTVPNNPYVSLNAGQKSSTIVYFDHNSARLSGAALGKINQIATMYQSGFTPEIMVEGHASQAAAAGSEDGRQVINLKISTERAYAVSRALIERGVPAEKIVTKAFGDTRPVRMDGGSGAADANRRVEVLSR